MGEYPLIVMSSIIKRSTQSKLQNYVKAQAAGAQPGTAKYATNLPQNINSMGMQK